MQVQQWNVLDREFDVLDNQRKLDGKKLVFSRPIEETYDVIDALDLERVKIKLTLSVAEGGYCWPEESALKSVLLYKEFLKRAALFFYERRNCEPMSSKEAEENMRISSDDKEFGPVVVDIVWHTHILFTKKYNEDCYNIFGFFLHHEPDA